MRAAFGDLVHRRDRQSGRGQRGRRATRCHQRESQPNEGARDVEHSRLIGILDADKHPARFGEPDAGAKLRFEKRLGKRVTHSHDLAGRLHLRPQYRVDPGKLDERKHRLLDREIRGPDFARDVLTGERLTHHAAGGDLGQSPARRL